MTSSPESACPSKVRGFAETIWADYLTLVRKRDGPESTSWTEGVRTLDDLLWSITAKERNAQKARLTKLVSRSDPQPPRGQRYPPGKGRLRCLR